ncbi:rRNA maturation RNase YbeY [Ferruginivarius sediminum]|uniref:Endoribonuclease YbeY n=1 Tax=Ferruginivarius sediminum TaxID=2661937 RepID=A0A369TFH0_9PROT|nr:rRNA maturation RNase YbeY [Ferruginivarius sediminum]
MSDEPPSTPFLCDLTHLAGDWETSLPGASDIAVAAVEAAYPSVPADRRPAGPAEVSLVLADNATVRDLNATYRGQDKPTNVLSFAALEGETAEVPGAPAVLGDIVLALETVLGEAEEQGKQPADHLRHLCVHGLLHLLGYDHQDDREAAEMEGLEVRVLAGMGVADPYGGERAAGDAA